MKKIVLIFLTVLAIGCEKEKEVNGTFFGYYNKLAFKVTMKVENGTLPNKGVLPNVQYTVNAGVQNVSFYYEGASIGNNEAPFLGTATSLTLIFDDGLGTQVTFKPDDTDKANPLILDNYIKNSLGSYRFEFTEELYNSLKK